MLLPFQNSQTTFKRARRLHIQAAQKDQRKCKTKHEKYKQWLTMKTLLIKTGIS